MIKTAEGRARLRSSINNVDTAKLSQLQRRCLTSETEGRPRAYD